MKIYPHQRERIQEGLISMNEGAKGDISPQSKDYSEINRINLLCQKFSAP